jgi:putative transposase
VSFNDEDRAAYLEWLRDYSVQPDVQILAYCLMANHIHVVAVPGRDEALQSVFRPLHSRYAPRINRARQWKGHLWQERFFSSALDETYLWAGYVELNPVRAEMARRAEHYVGVRPLHRYSAADLSRSGRYDRHDDLIAAATATV